VAKVELGTKRLCPNCGTKYYDLNHDPITCPRCGTVFEGAVERGRVRAAPVEEDEEIETEGAAEFVSLEEADKEAAETGAAVVTAEDDEEVEEIADDETDDTFLEEEEDEDDVTGISGDVDDDEET